MSKQDVESALSDLETAIELIGNNMATPVSGHVYPFIQSARRTLSTARKAMDDLHEHPHKEEKEYPEDIDPPTTCYCNATNFPPCGFCTRGVSS